MTDEAARRIDAVNALDAAQARAQALLRQGRCAARDAELNAVCGFLAQYLRAATRDELRQTFRIATEAAHAQLARYDAPVFVRVPSAVDVRARAT